ncbi:MAG: UDP-N-acetylmuramoyl-tripeptide--D-alanyl-D-alanine ligase, partial [Gemmatimonadota bacterium]
MTGWSSGRVASVLGTAPAEDREFTSVGTDTRTIEPGALFVALVGERFDGHDFIGDAIARGATGVVARNGTEISEDVLVFQVTDTLTALGDLGTARRHDITGPVVAVTGTNGKTAAKELLAKALGTQWAVHATRGNLNNLIGVPLTLLSAPDDTGALVVEAGASIPGEVARLREIIDPTIGVVTNVSAGHLEGFGSEEGVLAEKISLLEGVPTAVVGTLPGELAERARDVAGRVIVAGVDESADFRPDNWGLDAEGRAVVEVAGVTATLPLVGRHQVDNAMLAFAVARDLGLNPADVAAALETVSLPSGRCEILRDGDLVVLHDAYNANPVSIAASLETAQAMRGARPL